MKQCCDERATWLRLLGSEDDAIVARAMMFLVSMRDGRPAQQINVTSLGVNISATDVAKARDLVRQLVGTNSPVRGELPTNQSVNETDRPVGPLMLSGDEGAKTVG